ncbi:MAG: Gfo/Idh/MocA family oxidoreductase [Thermomicrobiales bacterium]|nr:Gfo/Idh/MocA family oxidoreductase [Thermomicrobiales bacterium]
MSGVRASGDLRVGLVGLGRFGRLHAAVLATLPGVELAAICDPDPAALAEVGDRFGVAARHRDLTDLLAGERIDAIFLVTPEPLHAGQALQVVERGIPLFLEKPLATTPAEGERVLAAAEAAGVLVQLGFLLRFEPQHALLRAEIAAGRFGPLVSMRVKRNCSRTWFPTYGDRVHPVYETSIHDIDLLLWFARQPCTSVFAIARNYSGLRYPDGCWALLQFGDGPVAMVETSWFVPNGAPANVLTPTWHGTIDSELEIVGVERSARLDLLEGSLAIWEPDYTARPDTAMWPEIAGTVGGALREEDRHFLDCVRAGVPSPIASARDALAGLRIAEAIVESAATGREVRLD